MNCKICNNKVKKLFSCLVMNKYQVDYFKCPFCDFIQTENPYWLQEAYSNAITDLDVGLVSRNINFSNILANIILNNFNYNKSFLDYAGGYGLFVRLMRDKGFDFYRNDKFCENIFANNFDLIQIDKKPNFEAVTAFEVFEHFENPLSELENLLQYSDTIIFSTELLPEKNIQSPDDWWYFIPETGQHIAFYSKKTLNIIADKFGLTLYTKNGLHILTRKKLKQNPFFEFSKSVSLKSLIQSDFELAKKIIKKTIEHTNKSETIEKNEELLKKLILLSANLDNSREELFLERKELQFSKNMYESKIKELSLDKEKLHQQIFELENKLNEFQMQLASVYGSREWKFALKAQKLFKKILPINTTRRRYFVLVFGVLKDIKNRTTVIKKNFFKKKRKINKKSKKIVYVGHSYHNKTKSTEFLIDFLKKFFEVQVVLDESWVGKPYPDLSFVDESYLGVVFFQLLPPEDVLKKIKNENLIFFPMYDQSGRLELDFWNKIRQIKIINFSKTLHLKLSEWGFETIFVQFFPKPQQFIPGKKDEVFFWQRITNINIETISKIFFNEKVKIHLHKAIDPQQVYLEPKKEIEDRFDMTYSEWFETREEMWNLIKEKGIYIAPREYEGIGMSFLEAMAMGKAVISPNNATMNEYIEHGKTGYLYDINRPENIDLKYIENVQKNTHKFMCEGYEKWEKEKIKIIEFILKK